MTDTPNPCELCGKAPACNLDRTSLGIPTPTVCRQCITDHPNIVQVVIARRAENRAKIQAEADKAGITFDQMVARMGRRKL